jgi:uncharacterized membrane protein
MDYPPFELAPPSIRRGSRWQRVALVFVFLWFFFGGLAHFLLTDVEMRIVPPGLPSPRALVLASGLFELLGAFGLLRQRTRRLAGWGLLLLTVAVTPANVYMLNIHEQFPVPEWLLWLRLPFQLVLLWLIWWGSRWRAPRPLYR